MWGRSVDSPLGTLRLVCRADALLAVSFAHHSPAPCVAAPDGAHPILDAAAEQLSEWLTGHRTRFALPIAFTGTPFQQTVWTALQEIPHGHTQTYGALARAIGRPGSARAVGAAVGRNPIAIVVPCHRVLGSGGRLTGFSGGLARKRWLLDHEQGAGGLFAGSSAWTPPIRSNC